jgi:hypothetical protein
MKQIIRAAIVAAEALVDSVDRVKNGLAATGVTDPRDQQFQLADDAELGARWTLNRLKDLDQSCDERK